MGTKPLKPITQPLNTTQPEITERINGRFLEVGLGHPAQFGGSSLSELAVSVNVGTPLSLDGL
jgi:hypothetical protein